MVFGLIYFNKWHSKPLVFNEMDKMDNLNKGEKRCENILFIFA